MFWFLNYNDFQNISRTSSNSFKDIIRIFHTTDLVCFAKSNKNLFRYDKWPGSHTISSDI